MTSSFALRSTRLRIYSSLKAPNMALLHRLRWLACFLAGLFAVLLFTTAAPAQTVPAAPFVPTFDAVAASHLEPNFYP